MLENQKLTELKQIQLDIFREFDTFCKQNNIPYFIIGGSTIGCVRHSGFIPWDDDIDVGLYRDDYDRFVELAHEQWTGRIQIKNYQFTENFFHSLTHAVDSSVFVMDEERICPVKTNVWIDVNPLDGFPKSSILRKMHYIHLRIIKNLIVLSNFESLFDMNKKRSAIAQLLINAVRKVKIFRLLNTNKLIKKLEKVLRKYNAKSSAYVGNFLGRYGEKEIMPSKVFKETVVMKFEDIEVPVMKEYDFYLRQLYGNYMELPPENERVNRHAMRIIRN